VVVFKPGTNRCGSDTLLRWEKTSQCAVAQFGTKQLVKQNKFNLKTLGIILCTLLSIGCSGGDMEKPDDNGTTDSGPSTSGGNDPSNQIDGKYSLSLPNQTVNLTEGSEATATIRVQRNNGYTGQVTVGAENQAEVDTSAIQLSIPNDKISSNQNSTTLSLKLDYSALPIQPETRTVRIVATDGELTRTALLTVNAEPSAHTSYRSTAQWLRFWHKRQRR